MIKNIKVICFGEILWDNLIQGRRIGGAPLNVCYHLNKNGVPSQIVSQIGNDVDGEELLAKAQALDVNTDFVNISVEHPTSTVKVHLLDDGKVEYDIVEHIAWDYIEFDAWIVSSIKDANAFVYGSLVARNSISRETLLAYLAFAKWKIFDVNLRKPFYNQDVVLELMTHCNTLKINDEELYTIGGWLGITNQPEQKMIDALFKNFPIMSEIILTRGSKGACYFNCQFKVALKGKPVKSMSTVGCGDSFLAGFLAYKIRGKSIEEAMRYAIALSAFVATHVGACPVYPKDLITNNYNP